MDSKKIESMLFDIALMVENLKVTSKENGQYDIIQKIYDVISLLRGE